MKLYKYILVLAIVAFGMPGIASAQCDGTNADVPTVLTLGQSYCIQVCAPFSIGTFQLEGDAVGANGQEYRPVLLIQSGCSPLSSDCNVDCTPMDVSDGIFELGGDPQGFYPDWWYDGNDCYEIIYRWSHDATWDIIITGFCDGCFCLTFDDQLDVELQSFSAVAGDGEVTLNWSTASETNHSHFEVTRDGAAMAQIEGRGNASGADYHWTDNDVLNGRTYEYGLIAVDVNGTRTALETAAATPNVSSATVTEYALHQNFPNPFNPETSIAFDLAESQFVTLTVTNLLGQEVATVVNGQFNSGRHVVSFDGSELAAGIYLYTITAGDFSAAKKFVLLK